jgi:hypothetical protein
VGLRPCLELAAGPAVHGLPDPFERRQLEFPDGVAVDAPLGVEGPPLIGEVGQVDPVGAGDLLGVDEEKVEPQAGGRRVGRRLLMRTGPAGVQRVDDHGRGLPGEAAGKGGQIGQVADPPRAPAAGGVELDGPPPT